MSLDIFFKQIKPVTVHSQNITHNLTKMAEEAGIYEALWRPEECGVKTAAQLAERIWPAYHTMREDPKRFKRFDAENGWGTYEDFIPWLRALLMKCDEFPDAEIWVSR